MASKFSHVFAKHILLWLFNRIQGLSNSYRPQIAFLPLVEDGGLLRPLINQVCLLRDPRTLGTMRKTVTRLARPLSFNYLHVPPPLVTLSA